MSASNINTNDAMPRSGAPGQGAPRDFITFGIAVAAIILFVGTAGQVLAQTMRNLLYGDPQPDPLLLNAVILNVALIILSWRRYRELKAEIDHRREAEALARSLAETDPLTGCLNRRSLSTAGAAMMTSARQDRQAVAALMLDLDHFKSINDLNGHQAGDQLLIELARRIRSIVPENALVARLGGDEFAVFIRHDARNRNMIDRYADAILKSVCAPVEINGLEVGTSTSIGIASSDEQADAEITEPFAQAVLHRADIAMYQAKKAGRGQSAWFEPAMETELRFRNEMEVGIRNGLCEGQFKPYYERQIDLGTGKLLGFEMLARWESPELGLVGPDMFIGIAEDMGIIGEISDRLIEIALEDASKWDACLTLSVNISPLQLRDPWFAQRLLQRLHVANFPPQRLEIEITESCLHENIEIVQAVLTSLKNQGVKISLDDFGTGYSSLTQLRSLPFDRIKIDRSFVRELGGDEGSAKIVESIVQLGRGLNMPVTAEGIESEEILNLLRSMGEMKGQGYHYGRPADAQATFEWLTSQNLVLSDSSAAPLSAEEAVAVVEEQPALRTA